MWASVRTKRKHTAWPTTVLLEFRKIKLSVYTVCERAGSSVPFVAQAAAATRTRVADVLGTKLVLPGQWGFSKPHAMCKKR